METATAKHIYGIYVELDSSGAYVQRYIYSFRKMARINSAQLRGVFTHRHSAMELFRHRHINGGERFMEKIINIEKL